MGASVLSEMNVKKCSTDERALYLLVTKKRFSYRIRRRYPPYEHILLASKNNNLPAN